MALAVSCTPLESQSARKEPKPISSPSASPTAAVGEEKRGRPSLRRGWAYYFRFGPDHMGCGTSRQRDFEAVRVARAQGSVLTLLRRVFRFAVRRLPDSSLTPNHVDPADWLEAITLEDGLLHLNFRRVGSGLGWASTSCGGGAFITLLMRNALQFRMVERVSLEFRGNCRRWPLSQGEFHCSERRADYEDYWGPLPTVKLSSRGPHRPIGTTAFYRLNPNRRKVDSYCGARDWSYVTRRVRMPPGSELFLTHAVRGFLGRVWDRPARQIESVEVTDGLATINFRSMNGLGIAGTTCGGVGFFGSLQRTVFQFPTVDRLRYELAGSCRAFGNWSQSGRCDVVTRGPDLTL